MQRQGDGEGEVPHMWKKGKSRSSSRTFSSVRLRCHNSCKSPLQVSVTVWAERRLMAEMTIWLHFTVCQYFVPVPQKTWNHFFNTFIVYSVIFTLCYSLVFLLNFCQLLIWSCASPPLYEDIAVILIYQDLLLVFSFSYCFFFFFSRENHSATTNVLPMKCLWANTLAFPLKETLGEATVLHPRCRNTTSHHCCVSVLSRGSGFAFGLVYEVKHTTFLLKGASRCLWACLHMTAEVK